MSNLLQITRNLNHNFQSFSGLAALSGYDPAMHRFFEALRHAIVDGVPALIRLHSTSEYSFKTCDPYLIDLENHAVCVIGYDDAKQMFAIMDPMKSDGVQWIRIDLLRPLVVDATLGLVTFLAPLWIAATQESSKLNIEIGFYVPKINVMDKDNMSISDVELTVQSENGDIVSTAYSSHTTNALTPHTFRFDVLTKLNRLVITAKAKVQGARPYPFCDVIESQRLFIFPDDAQVAIPDDNHVSVLRMAGQ